MRKFLSVVTTHWRKIVGWLAAYLFFMFWFQGLVTALKLTPYIH